MPPSTNIVTLYSYDGLDWIRVQHLLPYYYIVVLRLPSLCCDIRTGVLDWLTPTVSGETVCPRIERPCPGF